MKNFSIIIPTNNKTFQIKKAIKDLKVFFASTEYTYEVIFAYSDNLISKFKTNKTAIEKADNVTSHFIPNCKNNNKLIKKGIETSNAEAAITLDFERSNWRDILINLISGYEEGYEIVLTKFRKNKLSPKSFFARGFSNAVSFVYKLTLKMLGMKQDFMAENMYQLFDAYVVQTIKELPNKSDYLRNYNVWADAETKIVTLNVEKDTSILKDINYKGKDFIMFLTLSTLLVAVIVLASIFGSKIGNAIGQFNYLVLLILSICALFAGQGFFFVKDVIKQRADFPKSK